MQLNDYGCYEIDRLMANNLEKSFVLNKWGTVMFTLDVSKNIYISGERKREKTRPKVSEAYYYCTRWTLDD